MTTGPLAGFTIGVTADRGADEQIALLTDRGAECIHGPVIETRPLGSASDTTPAERLIRATIDRRVDALTFTTRPAVENLLEIAGLLGLGDDIADALAADVATFCVGPACATGLTARDVAVPFVPDRQGLGAMVQQIVHHFESTTSDIELAGTQVRVQGRLVLVGGGPPTRLTERERALFDVLLARPGVVCSKGELLRRVWRGNESDQHLVEVTIARLRQRLGPAAAGIETVMRRGYRVSAT